MKLQISLRQLVSAFFLVLALPLQAVEKNAVDSDPEKLDAISYFTALSNLANPIMFAGLGESLITSPYERDDWLRRAGYVTRPPMPDIAIVGPVYRSALPRFQTAADFSNPESLRWQPDSFDRTLDPQAQAWTLLKITSPQFHLQFHDLPENRLAALMMVPQARVQARLLNDRLRNPEGLFAPRRPDGAFEPATSADQAAALWGLSSLILAASRPRDDYWHQAYRALVDADEYRPYAANALAALELLPPSSPGDKAVAIEALGRYALIAMDRQQRDRALSLARDHGLSLLQAPAERTEDLAMAAYGLTEAGRLLGDARYLKGAQQRFRQLLRRWDEKSGLFVTDFKPATIVYGPRAVGALVAALDAMRWYGPDELARQARGIYPRFVENAVIRSGLLRASPRALISTSYLTNPLITRFSALPDPKKAGVAPVFVSEVHYENGEWRVTDPLFRTADALFLSNMLALRTRGEADTFLPDDLIKSLRGPMR